MEDRRLPPTAANQRSHRTTQDPIAVTVEDAQRLSGLGKTKLYELISQRKLKSVAVGRRRLILFASLVALLGGTGGDR